MNPKKLYPVILAISIVFFAWSCSKEKETNTPPTADIVISDNLDEIVLSSTASDPDGDPLTYRWSTNSSQVLLANSSKEETYFKIPQLTTPLDITVELTVSDGIDETTVNKSHTLPLLNDARIMGLGLTSTKEVHNDVKNEWYLDQAFSGTHALLNCGPTSVTMAIKWADSLFTKTPEDARNRYIPEGGWWYTTDIVKYLNDYSINNKYISLTNMNNLIRELDNGNIAILCVDMYYFSDEVKDRWHVDKFYQANTREWGHFIVAKGYKIVDGKVWYEVYDPYGFRKAYADGSPKGKNRYYKSEEVDQSTTIWWNYAIIISRESGKGLKGLNSEDVPRQHGG